MALIQNKPAEREAPGGLEVRIGRTGDALLSTFGAALEALPARPSGPQALAARLGIDKVLASRLLKAVRAGDAVSAVHRMPGPEPLRRVLAGLEAQGVPPSVLAGARGAVDRFETLIRHEVGDRAALDAIVSAWVPEARREFELRRKQAAFRAMSQLKGAEARAIMATVLLHPSGDGEHLDILWLNGLIGLQRLRPGASVKITTRRMSRDRGERQPRTLDGAPVNDLESLLLKDYCTSPMPALRVHHSEEVVHYALGGDGFGPGSAIDFVFAELSVAEIKRYRAKGSTRKSYVFAETSVPSGLMQFDALVHKDVFPPTGPGRGPELRVYDTAFEGVAGANDASRDIDIMDLNESVEPMGVGLPRFRSPDVPRYADLLRTACDKMGWDPGAFCGYRARIDYPVYGSQVTMLFEAEEKSER